VVFGYVLAENSARDGLANQSYQDLGDCLDSRPTEDVTPLVTSECDNEDVIFVLKGARANDVFVFVSNGLENCGEGTYSGEWPL
jgi:hypothetical protein